MKKIASILLCAAAVSFVSCQKTNNPDSDTNRFTCTIKVVPSETEAEVSVEVNNADTEYRLWVVETSNYKESVPSEALTLKGNATETFSGLKDDTEYTAVVYEASAGYKAKDFVTDKAAVTYDCLKGSDYIIISMDETTRKSIEGKTKLFMPSDGVYGDPSTGTLFFDWWNGGGAGTVSGPNFFGVVDGWFSITTSSGWFGYAFRLAEGTTEEEKATSKERREALKSITADYTLHIAMKASCEGDYSLGMLDGASVTIGNENSTYGFKRDGQWHEIEIPMAAFMAGEKYNAETGVNVLYWTQGSNGYPTTLDFDALFWYKK